MNAEDAVKAASRAFYTALNRMLAGDASALYEIWSHGPTVSTMHPIGNREIGWDKVKASFDEVARTSTGGRVDLFDQVVNVHGDIAYELGVERADFAIANEPLTVDSRVTNIYVRDPDGWKIVHHHGDKSSGILEALKRARTP